MTGWVQRREDGRREWLMQRDEAEQVACTDCGAAVGETCHHADGVPLGASPAHPARIKAANESGDSRPASSASRSNTTTREGQ